MAANRYGLRGLLLLEGVAPLPRFVGSRMTWRGNDHGAIERRAVAVLECAAAYQRKEAAAEQLIRAERG